MDKLPDLPQLESVETRDRDGAVLLVIFSGMLVLMNATALLSYFVYGGYIDTTGRIGIALIVLLTAWFAVRLLSGHTYFRTDGSGILMKGPLRRRFIEWPDVQSASAGRTRTGYPVLTLVTRSGRVNILPRGLGSKASSGYDIIASAWQHLRRLDGNERFELPEPARTFWEEIPDDIPRDIDWANPLARLNKITGIICIAIVASCGVAVWTTFPGFGLRSVCPAAYTLMLVPVMPLLIRELTQQACFVRLREDYVEATLPFGKAYIPWSRVVFARWQRYSLVIESDTPRHTIRVTHKMGNKESEQLILALIRRLRTAGTPQAIPLPLRPCTNPQSVQRLASSLSEEARFQAFLARLDEPTRKQVMKLRMLQYLGFVVGLALGGFVVFCDFSGALSKLLHGGTDSRFFIAPSTFASSGLMAGGILLGACAGERLGIALAGPCKDRWRDFLRAEAAVKSQRVVLAIFLLIAMSGILGFVAGVDSYARFSDNGITINRFFGVGEEFHPWRTLASVSRVETVRSRSISVVYVITFDDGKDWKCNPGNLLPRQQAELRKAIGFVCAESGKPLLSRVEGYSR